MSRRPKEPYANKVIHRKRKGKRAEVVEEVVLGGPPKKVTKGVRQQLIRLHRQNLPEFERQCAELGVGPKTFINQYIDKRRN